MRMPIGSRYTEMDAAMLALIHPTSIPLFVLRNDTAVVHGSGTLFAIGDSKFIVTAAHVIELARDAGATLYFGGKLKGQSTLCMAEGRGAWFNDGSRAGNPDVAAWRLTPREAAYFVDRKCIRLDEIDLPPYPTESFYCVAGFPTAFTRPLERDASADRMVEAIKLYTRIYDERTENLPNYNPEIHALVFGRTDTLEADEGNDRPFPDRLSGISGGQIWRVSCDEVQGQLRTRAALHAVQTSVYGGGRIIKGTRWNHVLALIFGVWPELERASTLLLPNDRFKQQRE